MKKKSNFSHKAIFLNIFLFSLLLFFSCKTDNSYIVTLVKNTTEGNEYKPQKVNSSEPFFLTSRENVFPEDVANKSDTTIGKKILLWSTNPSLENRSQKEAETDPDNNFLPETLYEKRKDITLYAIWTNSSFSITFDLVGAKIDDEKTSYTDTKTFQEDYLINDTIRDGNEFAIDEKNYIFLGWSRTKVDPGTYNKNPETDLLHPGSVITDNENVVLYAVWGDTTTSRLLVYDLNGVETKTGLTTKRDSDGIRGSANFDSDIYQDPKFPEGVERFIFKPDDSFVIEQAPIFPGFKFLAWVHEKDGKTTKYNPGDKVNFNDVVDKDGGSVATLTATYEELSYEISVNFNLDETAKEKYSIMDDKTSKIDEN